MKKQVFAIHGGNVWSSDKEYLQYLNAYPLERVLARDATKRWRDTLPETLGDDYQVFLLSMPSSQNARYVQWRIWFEKYVPLMDDDVILIGHSLGGIFLVKYLTMQEFPVHIAQLHLIAAPIRDTPDEPLEDFNLIDAKSVSVLAESIEKIHIYHSTNDPVVPFSDAEQYAKLLPYAQMHRFQDRGHFLQEDFSELITHITTI